MIPVLRLASADLTARAIDCLLEAGFGTVEITMTTPGAIELIRKTGNAGAGTVLDPDTAKRCLDAGAQFLVSPCLVRHRYCRHHAWHHHRRQRGSRAAGR